MFGILLLYNGCSRKRSSAAKDYVVVGIEGDVDTFNPLYAEDANASDIIDLVFPSMTRTTFDSSRGAITQIPSLARSWEFLNSGKDILFHLRSGARWADGSAVNAEDVQYSYIMYADTSVGSVRQDAASAFLKSGTIPDVRKSIEVKDDSTVIFHFDHLYAGELFDAGLPLLPSHLYEKIERNKIHQDSSLRIPVGAGPFNVKEWKPLQDIILTPNTESTLPHPGRYSQIIFRIIPDYYQRLAQIRSGEIDVLPYIEIADADALIRDKVAVQIYRLGPRFYDAINWNNIDGIEYAKSKGKHIIPNKLFGNKKIRQALTMAINRKQIIDAFFRSYGRVAFSPISPMFRWAYNDSIRPLSYNPDSAKKLFAAAGWKDTDGDGILDKDGKKFSFVLKIPSGNQVRAQIAAIVQEQLKAISVDMKIEQQERGAFWGAIMDKNFDACIAGFNVPLQMQLDELWGGDLQKSRFNIPSFQNIRIDEILAGARQVSQETDYAPQWKEFQRIIEHEQPCTFLYWQTDLVAANNRIHHANIDALGITYNAADWEEAPR
ncbi:MAG TPA: ABC transporter substrate-binding protein [Bacteroidota bacterium]|nr:ABC transporter substrate-binding protein [Bacteroidota bacterium]